MTKFRLAVAALCVTALAIAAAGTASQAQETRTEAVSGNLSIIGIWTGPEQKRFQAVLNGFKKLYPQVTVKYTSGGDNTPTILSTAIAGGNPPDLASIGQPGLLSDFANRGALKSIGFARATAAQNYTADWLKLGTVKGKLYGLFFKGANKSTVWYSTAAFKDSRRQGRRRPGRHCSRRRRRCAASGTPAFSIGGADGWTLTDLFENIYLRQAGPARYDQLTAHTIPWTHPSVKAALRTMATGPRRSANIVRRHVGRAADGLPHLGQQRLEQAAEGRDGDRGRLRPGCRDDEGDGDQGLQRLQVPVDRRLARRRSSAAATSSSCSRTARPARRSSSTWRRPRRRRSRRSTRPATRPRTRTSSRARTRTPLNRATAIQLAHAKTFRFDLSDLAAVGVRRDRRAG